MDNDSEEVDGWTYVIGSGGLKKKIITPGAVESRPNKGDLVRINGVGCLEDGTVVDEYENFSFTVGEGEVIDGIDLVIKLMDKGEESKIFMEARFAYGEKGLDNRISPNCDLYYTIKVLDFKPEEDPQDRDVKTRLEIGIQKRERGNWWFNREEYTSAIRCYKSSIDYLDDTSDTFGEALNDDLKELLQERLTTLNNMAAAQMKVDAYDMALRSLDSVLTCHPENVKALYRKGKILGYQGKAAEGYKILKMALQIEPDTKPLLIEAAKLQKRVRDEAESEKSLYRRMLGLNNSSQEQEIDRYPTLRGIPMKLWAGLFMLLFCGLLVIQYVTKSNKETIPDDIVPS